MKYEEMPYSRIDFAEETRYLKELMKRFQAAKSAEEPRETAWTLPMRFTIRRRIIMTGSIRLTAISLWSTRSCC